MERYFDHLILFMPAGMILFTFFCTGAVVLLGNLCLEFQDNSFVPKEFIRCFYIAGEFKVVDSMYV